jgi:hypothetical protein
LSTKNTWNAEAQSDEWQEGSYIEPNEEFGFGMYDALRDAFCVPAKGDERMKLLWGTETTPLFSKDFVVNDASMAALPIRTDGKWHTYSVPLAANPSWTDRVNEIWFDPVNLNAAYVDIKWMRFEE